MPAIPIEIWRQIGQAPTLYSHANQWGEHGYVVVEGKVYEYTIDRKEQYDRLLGTWTVEAFLAQCQDEKTSAWVREQLEEPSR